MAISLSKGQKVSLKKTSSSLGEIVINLRWNQKPQAQGFFKKLFGGGEGIDLDLGCLYELKNGRKGTVQALGDTFGSLKREPYIFLDGDDRTGASLEGETIRIDGNQISQIKRVLVYTFIYEGIANWKEADATVSIRYPGAEEIIVKMDTFNTEEKMCALVLFENQNDETFSVEKIVQFFPGHRKMDEAFKWGLKWVVGHK